MIKRNYLIFVPDNDINEKDAEYSAVIEWVYNNLSHSNVMILSLDDVYYLEHQSEMLDIINEENHSMLREGEDDWIISNEEKLRIKRRLLRYEINIRNKREKEIVTQLLLLLDRAIENDKYLYFRF